MKTVARLFMYDEGNCFYKFGLITDDLSDEFAEEYHGDCFELTKKELINIKSDASRILKKINRRIK